MSTALPDVGGTSRTHDDNGNLTDDSSPDVATKYAGACPEPVRLHSG